MGNDKKILDRGTPDVESFSYDKMLFNCCYVSFVKRHIYGARTVGVTGVAAGQTPWPTGTAWLVPQWVLPRRVGERPVHPAIFSPYLQ